MDMQGYQRKQLKCCCRTGVNKDKQKIEEEFERLRIL
jgi:hypothetical protein